jgi:hypothetical protein
MKTLEFHVIDLTDRLAENAQVGDWQRAMLTVSLERRYRDLTLSDRFGYFSSRGHWRDLADMQELRTFNIVQPAIRATKAVITQANPRVEIQPRFEKNYRQQLAAEVARILVEQDDREFWNAALLEQLGDLIQIAPGAFIKTEWCDKESDEAGGKTAKVTHYNRRTFVTSGEALCPHCDNAQLVGEMIVPDESGIATVPCEECGSEAVVTTFPQMEDLDLPAGQSDYPVGAPVSTVHSGMQFLVDENGTAGGNLKKAKWLCHRYLVPRFELENKYGKDNLNLTGGGSLDWSFATKWLYALERNHPYLAGAHGSMMLEDFELHEVCDWYFVPALFKTRIEESECQIGKLKLKPKDNILKKLGNPSGVMFRRVGNEIAEVAARDFRKIFQYVSFLRDAHGFWSIPQTVLLTCQDLITEYVTIQSDVASRNITGTTIVDSEYLNEEDLLQPVVRTKKGWTAQGQQFQPAMHIPPAPISPAPMQMVELSVEMKDRLSGVSSIMMGELPGNEPYSSVALQREQSLGLLSTALHSIALAKTEWTKHRLRLRQENMSDEEYAELVEFHESLTPEHIDAFREANVESDFAIDYRPGTAVPRSLFERELALRQQMNDFIALASLNPEMVTPATVNDLLGALSELTNTVEIDINNVKADKLLAQTRYQALKEFAEKLEQKGEEADEEILMEILENPLIAPLSIEGHATHKEFYADRLRQLAMQEGRNFTLETLCKAMYAKHEELEIQFAQFQTQKMLMAQAPAMMQQQAMMQGQKADEQQQKQNDTRLALAQKKAENDLDTEKLANDEAIKSRYNQPKPAPPARKPNNSKRK